MPRLPAQHVDDPAAVGARIRQARERVGVTQRGLSFAGCSYAYISRIEAGARVPSMQLLQELGRRLGVSSTYLATGSDAPDAVDPLDEADLERNLGAIDRAATLYLEAALDQTAAGQRRGRALAGLAEIAFQRGDLDLAAEQFEGAHTHELDPGTASLVADRLGRIHALRGEYERSIAVYERELARVEALNDHSAVMRFSTLLANAVLDAGNVGRASELLARAIVVADESADPLGRARLWWTQSRLHDSQGQPELAARYARLALAVLEERDQVDAAGVAHLLLAYIENERGDGEAALRSLERAEAVISQGTNDLNRTLLLIERARALLLTGDREEAGSLAMSVLPKIAGASTLDSGRAQALLADVFRELGERERAQELYELALETLPSVDRNLLRVYGGLAAIHEEAGRKEAALELLKQAMSLQQHQAALT